MDTKRSFEVECKIRKILTEVSKDFHNVFTPFELCSEIIDKVHQNFIPSEESKYLVIANLEFVWELKNYLELCNIGMKNVWFATPCEYKAKAAQSMGVANIIKYSYENICKGFKNMPKFDVVLGNPPYQSPGKENKKKLWPQFIDIAFNELVAVGGCISFITPKVWLTNGQWEKHFLTHQIVMLNIDQCKRYFADVHSTFSYFIVKNQPAICGFDVVTDDGLRTYTTAPRSGLDLMYTGIIKKLICHHDYFQMITSSGYNTSGFSSKKKTLSRVKTDQHTHFVVHKISHAKEETTGFWSSELDQTTYGVPRVIVGLWLSDWKYERMVVSTELLTCEQFRHFPTATIEEAEVLRLVLSSKLYTYLLYNLVDGNSTKSKAAGSITNRAVSYFPKIDLSRSWTDEELYKYFNLTLDEIKLIEETIK